jgi:uncharacterized membrane protein YoaK (UPF0700 family)
MLPPRKSRQVCTQAQRHTEGTTADDVKDTGNPIRSQAIGHDVIFCTTLLGHATMPVDYLRSLTAVERSRRANVHLGVSLCFIAGAVNAGGFLAIGAYTSHMTGVVSSMADELVLGRWTLVTLGLASLLSFIVGAAVSAILINMARRQRSRHEVALPLMLEAGLLLAFGLLGAAQQWVGSVLLPTAMLLCFIMGLQNAMITKVSQAEIRTTHVTSLVTDIGIELGKLLYWNRTPTHADGATAPRIQANRARLRLHTTLVGSFFLGGLVGALGFKHAGYVSTVPLAIALGVLASGTFMPERAGR